MEKEPTKSTIIYDKNCNFCCHQIDFIQKNFIGNNQLNYLGFEDINPEELNLENFCLKDGLIYIDEFENIYQGSDSVYNIAKNIKFLKNYTFLYEIKTFQKIFQGLYSIISNYRYLLSKFCKRK